VAGTAVGGIAVGGAIVGAVVGERGAVVGAATVGAVVGVAAGAQAVRIILVTITKDNIVSSELLGFISSSLQWFIYGLIFLYL
jgi:hypothetical protein